MAKKLDGTKAWTVNRSAWHYKVYDYWFRRMATSQNLYKGKEKYVSGKGYVQQPGRPENFCHYFRVVALYVPLYFLPIVGIILAIVGGVIFGLYALFTTYGFGGGLLQLLLGAVGAVAFIAVCWALAKGIEYLRNRHLAKKSRGEVGFFRAAMDAKTGTKLCPLIEFEGKAEGSAE